MPDLADSDQLLIHTIARIRIATKLYQTELHALPVEVEHLMAELGDLRLIALRAIELYERWELEHDPNIVQFAEWDGLKKSLKSAGAFPASLTKHVLIEGR